MCKEMSTLQSTDTLCDVQENQEFLWKYNTIQYIVGSVAYNIYVVGSLGVVVYWLWVRHIANNARRFKGAMQWNELWDVCDTALGVFFVN